MHLHPVLALCLATAAGTGVVVAQSSPLRPPPRLPQLPQLPKLPQAGDFKATNADYGIDPKEELIPAPRQNHKSAPKRFIVELKEGADLSSLTSKTTGNVKVLKVFNTDVFRGAVVETDEDNVDSLRALRSVGQAWHSKRIMLDPVMPEMLVRGGAQTGVKLSRQNRDEGVRQISVHHMTGVDELHARGILGKGVKVAVVDSGIDYTHPALGGAFGAGNKVVGGYDLIGDTDWPFVQKQPDDDPMDHQGHGTHVAGIIAGKDELITGVAPEATLLAYKVFGENKGTDEDTLIEAFLRAYQDGADVITASIGGLNGWSNNAWALVASRLVERGIVVTISAGNDGQAGPFGASSGATGINVVSVASVQGDVIASPRFIASFQDGNNATQSSEKMPYRTSETWTPSEVVDWPFHAIGFNTSVADEACNPLPNNTMDLSRVVVLARRGTCTFAVKQRNLEARGARHIVFYNNEQPLIIPGSDNPSSVSNISMIAREDGERIIETIRGGGRVLANFNLALRDSMAGIPYAYGGVPSAFTSIGSTNELAIKPDVAAPGGQIFSTFLKGGYATQSGTSMSCPYVAGIAALYISKHGGRSTHGPGFAKELAMRLISAGQPVPWDDGTESGRNFAALAPVNQVGTGLINATKVLDYTSALSLSRFALNDTNHFERYHKVDVTNRGSTPVTYTFQATPFSGMETFNTDPAVFGTPRVAWYEEVMAKGPRHMPAEVSLPESFTLQPGQTRTAQFNFAPPTGLDASVLPLYGGAIDVQSSAGEVLSVPYMGLAADLHRGVGPMFIDPTNITTTRRATPLAAKPNTTFTLAPGAAQDFPEAYIRLQFATAELRWDVFEPAYTERDWAYPPVVGQNKYVGSVASYAQASRQGGFDPATMNASDTVSLPIRFVPRSAVGTYGETFWWLGRLANGSAVAPGQYRLRLAALVPFGTPENADNWDVFDAPLLEVLEPGKNKG
ncbi:hypothetical protein MCOR27_004266 [Pyricularia oryzae]|uniref:Minor extracellular protease vpr n=1 Tax=Pyricularia grisea TaxID=148305 RepID=A0ABQ8N4X7_PYRGI|nr:hypothetical protein MCOR01_005307 [Pyricularia oryzae]KAI6291389.1 hypothetical protein MCOR33_010660 [Pyricularia grisea]KAI6252419.1 hypothetical protein MCOR19_010967 [Pyricularia oryzae]KAI6271746.1 hypothetical protein MCOR26_007662 [Pyricularia oryzae]KAI6281239.1 hypothetical protein MCOR27_004266 [Pyricularia oryzae]